jgi:cold shock CspA family protein
MLRSVKMTLVERGTLTAMSTQGFGFIAPDRTRGELWMAPRGVDRDGAWPLREGQRVEFEVAFGTLGLEATRVRPLEP